MAKKKKKSNGLNYERLPRVFVNKYFITAILFFIWLLFFDRSSVITHVKLQRALNELEDKRNYYTEEIEIVNHDLDALLRNPKEREKYARERYYMKKANEDVFVIEKEPK